MDKAREQQSILPQMTESQLVSAIIRRCWFERTWLKVWRANAGKVATIDEKGKKHYYQGNIPGCPDVIGFFAPIGRFIGFEAKIGKNVQTEYQKVFQIDSDQHGALYFIIRSIDDLERAIDSIRPGAAIQ